MFNKLFAVGLLVDDFETSLSFYKDVLGLKIHSQEGKFAEFKLKGASLAIFPKDEATAMFSKDNMNRGGGSVIGFQVESVNKTCKTLKSKGVKIFEGPKTTEWGQTVVYI